MILLFISTKYNTVQIWQIWTRLKVSLSLCINLSFIPNSKTQRFETQQQPKKKKKGKRKFSQVSYMVSDNNSLLWNIVFCRVLCRGICSPSRLKKENLLVDKQGKIFNSRVTGVSIDPNANMGPPTRPRNKQIFNLKKKNYLWPNLNHYL